jgi:hypothetical protein
MAAAATQEANRSYRDVLRNRHVVGLPHHVSGSPRHDLRPVCGLGAGAAQPYDR